MAFGVTETGWNGKTIDDVLSGLQSKLRSRFGAEIDLQPDGPYGQFAGIGAEAVVEVWDMGGGVYASFYRESAVGASLDKVGGLTGTQRLQPTKSTVTLTATGTPATSLLTGRVVQVVNGGAKFTTLADVIIAALTAWAGLASVTAGQRRTNASRAYECIFPGTTAASGGPTTTATDITDGSAHWKYLGEGTGAVDVACAAQDFGPKVAPARTLSSIVTAVSGWQTATNLLDAAVGRNVEVDPPYRVRQETDLRAQGNAALDAIRADVLEVGLDSDDPVTACTVFENEDDVTNGDGLPPHSIEVLVLGGDDQEIADAIWASKAAGIATYGGTSMTVTDSAGGTHTVKFSRPTLKPVYIVITITYDNTDNSLWPSDGEDQVKAAIVAWGDARKIGDNVVASAIGAQSIPDSTGEKGVPGVLDASPVYIGFSASPVASTTLAISLRELATYDTSRVDVTLVGGIP